MAHPFKPATAEELRARGVGAPTPAPVGELTPAVESPRKSKSKKPVQERAGGTVTLGEITPPEWAAVMVDAVELPAQDIMSSLNTTED